MRLETFVDIMGINVIQVIERIQQRGISFDRPPCPDDYLNPDWPQNISSGSVDKRGHAASNETLYRKINGTREEKLVESANASSPTVQRTNEEEDLGMFSSYSKLNTELDQKLPGVQGSSNIRSDKPGAENCLARSTASSQQSSDFKSGSRFIWRRPNVLRLPAPKDFIKSSVKTYSDAVKMINRGARYVPKNEQTNACLAKYDGSADIFDELLPPHIDFYNKFYT